MFAFHVIASVIPVDPICHTNRTCLACYSVAKQRHQWMWDRLRNTLRVYCTMGTRYCAPYCPVWMRQRHLPHCAVPRDPSWPYRTFSHWIRVTVLVLYGPHGAVPPRLCGRIQEPTDRHPNAPPFGGIGRGAMGGPRDRNRLGYCNDSMPGRCHV